MPSKRAYYPEGILVSMIFTDKNRSRAQRCSASVVRLDLAVEQEQTKVVGTWLMRQCFKSRARPNQPAHKTRPCHMDRYRQPCHVARYKRARSDPGGHPHQPTWTPLCATRKSRKRRSLPLEADC